MTDIQIIEQIEKQCNIKLKSIEYSLLESNSFVLDSKNNVISLNISDVEISDLSLIANLKSLKELILNNNQIIDISPIKALFSRDFFASDFSYNPLKYPPYEIVELGNKAVKEYFEHCEIGTSILQEAKIIVIGEAGAGKTTFTRRLQNPTCPMPLDEETTYGVDVADCRFMAHNNNNLKTRIWDFGGQSIYHGTHQFFFSDKSLYVLIADTREEKSDFNYWLNTVEQITGENSPLVILLNRKHKHYYQIDETGLRSRFGSIIRRVIDTNLADSSRIPELQEIIQHEIESLPQIGYTLPTSWVAIRKQLGEMTEKYISFAEFRNICKQHGIKDAQVVKIISRLFTNIGVFTHFPDEDSSLHDIIFLDSDWLTKTVYLLLNSEIVKIKQGRISFEDISQIWNNDDLIFEKNKFIELLKKFSLIYRINGSENYIVPEYLPMLQPYPRWKYFEQDGIYQFRYLFDNFMPKAIMPKLIVALHRFIYDNTLVWHRGVNIANSIINPDTYAEILETYGRENKFDIRIYGKKQKDLLNIIIYHFDNILKPFKKLTHQKLVPCNCDTCKTSREPHFYKYLSLLKREKVGKNTIECDKSFKNVEIKTLLYGVIPSELRNLLLNEKFEEFKNTLNQKFGSV